jgi:hypothetical protein
LNINTVVIVRFICCILFLGISIVSKIKNKKLRTIEIPKNKIENTTYIKKKMKKKRGINIVGEGTAKTRCSGV